MVHVGELPLIRVQFERREICEPHECREVLDDAAPLTAVRLERLRCRTQLGWCGGQRFSKNRSPAEPSGARTRVGGRPARCGSIDGCDAPVVVDDVGLAEARGRVQQLVEVGEGKLATVDLDTDPRLP